MCEKSETRRDLLVSSTSMLPTWKAICRTHAGVLSLPISGKLGNLKNAKYAAIRETSAALLSTTLDCVFKNTSMGETDGR